MRIVKNFFYNSFYQMLMCILPLVTAPYVARILGAESAGIYSYSYSIAYYFVLIAMLGLNNYGNRCVAEVRNSSDKLNIVFSSIYYLQFIVASLVVGFYFVYIIFFVHEYKFIFIIQSCYVVSAAFDITWFFNGLEEFKTVTIRNSFVKIATAVLTFALVKSANDLWIYTLILSGGFLVSQLVVWPFIRKYVKFVRVDGKTIFNHLKPNIILLIPALATSIYRIMDKVMIGSLSTMNQVSYYDYADKLINVALGFSSALTTVTMPKVSNMIANVKNTAVIEQFTERVVEIAMIIVCATAFGLYSISNEFIPMFYGENYISSIDVLNGLCIAMIFMAWANAIRTQYLIPQKKDTIYLKSVCLGAGLNIVINYIFISKYGAIGAVIGTIVAESTVAIYQTYKIKDIFPLKKNIMRSMPYFIIGLLMSLIVRRLMFIVNMKWGNLILVIFVGGIFFIAATIVYWKITNNYFYQMIKIRMCRN